MIQRVVRGFRHAGYRLIACGFFVYLTGGTPSPYVRFTDITESSNIDFKQENSATSNKYLVETMGGGVALLDYDK
ncbi:MAG: hypothetical protein ABSE28_19410 [Candidatus Sulfotelmatobacter sp.]|jgi:hypothetical protein